MAAPSDGATRETAPDSTATTQTASTPTAAPAAPPDWREITRNIPEKELERLIREDQEHPLSKRARAEASRGIERYRQQTEQERQQRAAAEEQVQRLQDFQALLDAADEVDDYGNPTESAVKASKKINGQHRQELNRYFVRQELEKNPEILQESARKALVYQVEEAAADSYWSSLGEAVIDEARKLPIAQFWKYLHDAKLKQMGAMWGPDLERAKEVYATNKLNQTYARIAPPDPGHSAGRGSSAADELTISSLRDMPISEYLARKPELRQMGQTLRRA